MIVGSTIINFLEFFFGLPFLSPKDVTAGFTDDLMTTLPQNDAVVKFCNYVLDNYITECATYLRTI